MPPSAHDVHAPAQAVSQQTPCAQKPEPHSPAAEHEAPMPLGPHEFPLQTFSVTQSWFVRQALKQAPPMQT